MTKFKNWLSISGLKKTKHRILILDILDNNDEFLSADDIYLKAKEVDDSISLSTVYRILEQFTKSELITPITVDYSKQVLYELKHDEHTHHLICLNCKKVIHVKGCPIHDYQKDLANKYGFKMAEHKLDFYGYCKKCASKME
ncbi:MAG: Fur family transcriptional regulator [Candidatus Izemoplasmataceae bacterium]|jgi:Fur family transcriptional regulator, ferric uptake regulator|uniref:Fur family transcriptional regulator n=1 Tax=Liberiplasma polymorphum TaxID=3374570 RepID=UPI0037752448